MRIRLGTLLILALCGIVLPITAQNQPKSDTTIKVTLKQAQEYALKNSPVIKNAELDLESAKKKIWETTAIGLPQVNSKLAYSYAITLSSTIEQFSSLSSMMGKPSTTESKTSTDDLRWGLTYDITATQLLFSGAYIVGLQTSKTFKQLSEISITKSQNDLSESVSNAYFLTLIARENKKILDSIYYNTEKIYNELKVIQKSGFMEESDVEQIELTLTNIKNTREMIDRQCAIALNLLKFQMGLEFTQQVELTENIDALITNISVEAISSKEFKVDNSTDFQLLTAQENLAGLNLKLQKSAFLPDVAAFYNHQENFNKKAFSFTPPNMVGLNVSIPIFGSGMKIARVQQAKIGLDKIKNAKYQASLGLQMQFDDAKSAYLTALSKYSSNKRAIDLAFKIYNKSLIKYKEGLSSSLELAQTQTQYLQAQSNYYSSIIELSGAFAKIEKLLK